MRLIAARALLLLAALSLAACGDKASLTVADGTGGKPTLPAPRSSLIPTINVADARSWTGDEKPVAADGLKVVSFASGLSHPRWLYVLPNGDVLVAESNAPQRPEEEKGLKAKIMGWFMKKAGAGVPSANRITLLRDADNDGVAEVQTVFLEGLNSPFGMTLVESTLYVANTDGVIKYPYTPGDTHIAAPPVKVAPLPAGRRNHHWTKNVIAAPDGAHLYATVGSNSNAAENGIEEETGRAAIWEIDPATGTARIFATGLRNPNGLGFEPATGVLWAAVNERDELGSDLVPDYMTSVKDGGFYGWPYSYYGAHVDTRVKPQRPELVSTALAPDYALGPHTASLGLAFSAAGTLTPAFDTGVFIGQHGSWNRDPPSGYKVIFVPFANGRPSGPPVDVLTGFLGPDGIARGRPVGVVIDTKGGLLVADDVGNRVWRVSAAP